MQEALFPADAAVAVDDVFDGAVDFEADVAAVAAAPMHRKTAKIRFILHGSTMTEFSGEQKPHPLLPPLADWGETPAIGDGTVTISGVELEGRSRRVAVALARRGLHKGDRLAVVVRSSLDAVVVIVGALRRGLVVVPINPGYQESELGHVLADSGAALVVVAEACAALAALAAVAGPAVVTTAALLGEADVVADDAEGVVAVDDDDLALLVYTSGTTGRSKGCAHTAGGLARGIGALVDLWGIDKNDVVVNPLPLFHVHGLCVCLLGALMRGAATRLVPAFSPAAVVEAVFRGGTVLMSVPTMVHRLMQSLDEDADFAEALGRLRLMTCGSAALSAELLLRFRAKTGLTILERYGMTETLITLSNPLTGARKPGSVGWPVPGTRIRVVDDELQVKSPGMMRGYWRREDADATAFTTGDGDDAGWFLTGDVVAIDDDGAVRIVGRASHDVLKVGGFKISAREIEEQLERHPAVAEVCVVGVADEEWGEKIVAVVVLRETMTLTLAEAQAATALTAAKKPRSLVVVSELPRNAMGKVMKAVVKARLLSASAAR